MSLGAASLRFSASRVPVVALSWWVRHGDGANRWAGANGPRQTKDVRAEMLAAMACCTWGESLRVVLVEGLRCVVE
ncbi:hypothetical protein HDK90DRAFT_483577 [Phyllosticta capitalensis]|uniref:Secreted protein n=1 Tax=Phyllosticta capitalensis TaxID=121624 RepID=A0ABR1YUB4_9PEZI